MNKTTDFLALPVLSLADARIIGKVQSVLFDEGAKQAIYLAISADGIASLLPYDKVMSKSDAAVIDSTLSLVDACDVDMSALNTVDGKDIYTQTGEFKGKALEVELFASGKTSKIVAEGASYTPSAFQHIGDVLLLKPVKKRTVRHTIPKDTTDRKVEILEQSTRNNVSSNKTAKQVQDNVLPQKPIAIEQGSPFFSQDALEKIVGQEVVYIDTDERTPARIIGDYDFLLGRTLLHDITTYAGTLLAKQGTVITKDLVELASRNGKLVDLTLNSSYK